MRSILILFILVSICRLGAQTLEEADQPASNFFDSYTLASSASFGFLYGQSEEQVYKSEETLLSQLLWDMKPLFYYGSTLEFSRLNPMRQWGPFAVLSFRFGFPGRTGVMEDRDWQAEYYGLPDGTLTDFSSHDNYTRGAMLADASIGVSVPIASILAIRGYIAYSYMFFAWNGRDGYGDYYPNSHQVYSGAVINYSQMWNMVSGGIALSYPFLNVFSVSAAFQVGSVVSYSAVDDHLTNKKQFIDTASGGLLLEPRFEFTWTPLSKLSVALNAGYRYISALKGTSVEGNNPNKTPIGAAYSVWDAGLSVKVCF